MPELIQGEERSWQPGPILPLEMSAITINTDGISDKQKASAKFRATYQGMMAQLSSPGFIPVLCTHEAAHLVYFTIAGVRTYEAIPAKIQYDSQSDDYVGSLASVQMLDIPKFVAGQFWELFFKIACAHAAGGVVARKLMPSTDGGDEDDRERFEEFCEGLSVDPNFSIDVKDYWKQTQEKVAEDLRNPEWLAAIQNQAAELRPQFGL